MKVFYIFLSLFLTTSYASHAIKLYEADIITPHTKPDARDLKAALQIVLNRLTPGPNDLDNPITQTADPKKFVSFVQQQTIDNVHGLHIGFHPNAINQLMEESGQQPWIKNRPKLFTVVMMRKSPDFEDLVSKAGEPDVYAALERAATEKGLELVYPSPEEIHYIDRGMHIRPRLNQLVKATVKMHPEALLYIEMRTDTPPGHISEFSGVYFNNHRDHMKKDKLPLSENVGHYSMALASAFVFQQGERRNTPQSGVYVNVGNIKTVKDYHLVEHYLSHIPGVVRASINSVTADAVLYKLDITIPPNLLEKRLARKYKPVPSNPDEGIMHYHLKT